MAASTRCCCFGEDGPRPPVPGKEDVTVRPSDPIRPENYRAEEGRFSDHAHTRWAESLHTLLDDQEGITLFRAFLGREGSADVIDFWLACRGFWLAYCSPPRYEHMLAFISDMYSTQGYMHIFGLWEKPWVPGGNPRRHGEKDPDRVVCSSDPENTSPC